MITPQDFASWTKQDRRDFENLKNIIYLETEEEKVEREIQEVQILTSKVKDKLASVGIAVTKIPNDFWPLYSKYIKAQPRAKERIGDDLQSKIDYLSAEKNNLKDFCNFVLQY